MVAVLCLGDDVASGQRMRDTHLSAQGGRICRHRPRGRSLFFKSGIPSDGMAVLLSSLVLLCSWGIVANAAEDPISKMVDETQKAMMASITSSIKKDIGEHTIVARSASGGDAAALPDPTGNSTDAASNSSAEAKAELTARSAGSDSGNGTATQNGTDISPRAADGGNSTDSATNGTAGADITARSAGGGGNSTAESGTDAADQGNSTQPLGISARSSGGDAPTVVASAGDAAAANDTSSANSTAATTTAAPAASTTVA